MDNFKDATYSLLDAEGRAVPEEKSTRKFYVLRASTYSIFLNVVLALSLGANIFFLFNEAEATKPSVFGKEGMLLVSSSDLQATSWFDL